MGKDLEKASQNRGMGARTRLGGDEGMRGSLNQCPDRLPRGKGWEERAAPKRSAQDLGFPKRTV